MDTPLPRPGRTPTEYFSQYVVEPLRAFRRLILWILAAGILAMIAQGVVGSTTKMPAVAGWAGFLVFVGVPAYRFRRTLRSIGDLGRNILVRAGLFEAKGPAEPASAEPLDELVTDEGDTVLGTVIEDGRETDRVACLSRELRNRHVYVIGKTRMGKTSLLKSMILQDIERGDGLCFLDPHGDAAEELLGLIPPSRAVDVVYFDPTRKDSPSFNPFALPFPPAKLAEDIVSVFRMLLGDSWGPRMEHLLRFGVLTLLADPKTRTLRDLRRLYLDDTFRADVLREIENEQLREFWEVEYPAMPTGAAAPILNKLSAFLTPMSDLERVFSQPDNDLNFSLIFDLQDILIVNLAKGKLGDEPARLLGGLIVTGVQQAALARASEAPEERKPFALYVDEFQNFTVASFESILAESAKYQVNLTLANQNLGQLSSSLERAIFGNCSTLVAFQVSAEDADRLQREMRSAQVYVRNRNGGTFDYTLEQFRFGQFDLLRRAIGNKYGDEAIGICLHDLKHLFEPLVGRVTSAVGPRVKVFRYVWSRLEDPSLDLVELRQLFPTWDFRESTFPEPSQLTTISPRHAICRIGRSDIVAEILCAPVPEPDQAIRKDVDEWLAFCVRKRAERAAARPPEPQPTPAPVEPSDFRE